MSAVSAQALASPTRIASTRALRSRAAPRAATAGRAASVAVRAAATIQFVKGTIETSVPDVRLTKSKDGTNGTAFFTFAEPDGRATC